MYYNIGIAIVMFAAIIFCSYQAVMLRHERRAYHEANKEVDIVLAEVRAIGKDALKHLHDVQQMHIAEGERLSGWVAGVKGPDGVNTGDGIKGPDGVWADR